jgi:hypothetical protein
MGISGQNLVGGYVYEFRIAAIDPNRENGTSYSEATLSKAIVPPGSMIIFCVHLVCDAGI